MGYQTRYKLVLLNLLKEGEDCDIIEDLIDECDEASYSIYGDGKSNDPNTWYEHENDLKSFSKKHPDIIFELSGEGSEVGDIWSKYFKNGKVQVENAKIVVGEYCENKLK